ncbi:MAG: LysR family transcriptional regulator [Burkholderiaceae bacterium]
MDIDLKLLSVFIEIHRTGSVSLAAENLGWAQPTASIALGKLRRYFDDPLFVRTSTGMRPTPRAQSLHGPLADALERLEAALRSRHPFDPATSARSFRLQMTDISQVVLVPRLVSRIAEVAPSIRTEILDIDDRTPQRLESGEADLAIGFMPQLESGFRQQVLFEQRFVCLVRDGHPHVDSRMTLRQFQQASHIEVMTPGTGHAIVDRFLQRRGIERRIALKVPNFLGLARIVAETDLIVTVPARLGEAMAGTAAIRSVAPPLSLPPFAVRQHWHERYHRDPPNRWLRELVAALFGRAGPNRGGLGRTSVPVRRALPGDSN